MLTVCKACDLQARVPEESWLVEGLWGLENVGIIGGLAKAAKSWLAFEMAVAVASGRPCLGRYPVPRPGRVLLYAAEDSLPLVRERLEGICRYRGISFPGLDVHVITDPVIRLDRPEDRRHLNETVAQFEPRLLILDPLVRVSGRLDENSAGEVAAFLGHLRELQRTYRVAVLLVHHARKTQGGGSHAVGQALRGSGDIYAWVDTLLYMRRIKDASRLLVEHRSAASPEPVSLRLVVDGHHPPHLETIQTPEESPAQETGSLVLSFLTRQSAPVSTEFLRRHLKIRKQRVIQILIHLEQGGQIERGTGGWSVKTSVDPSSKEPARPLTNDAMTT